MAVRSLAALFLMLSLSGCAALTDWLPKSYPLDMSEQEWLGLSPEQQLQARERQKQLEIEARAQREQARLLEQELEMRRAAELAERRAEAGYGERVQCLLEPAQGYLGGKWRDLQPAALDLLIGEQVTLSLSEGGSGYRTLDLQAEFDGQTVLLCRSGRRACDRLVSTSRGFDRGVSREMHIERNLRATMRCELAVPRRHRRH